MLDGEILYRRGDFEVGLRALRRSVEIDDSLPYDEPWGWMQPTRHALGALLLEQGQVAEAEAVFREDLGLGGQSAARYRPPRQCLEPARPARLPAAGREGGVAHIRNRLDLAQARADTRVAASCFCAQKAMRAAE